MLRLDQLDDILAEYLEHVVPTMVRRSYHLILVKGGPDYAHLPEQSHFAHIVNGVFGMMRLLRFLAERKVHIPGLDEASLRQTLALFTTHEVHKDHSIEKLGGSEFAVPLERLREEYNVLGLDRFATVDDHLLRAANVHKRSKHHGDLLLSGDPQASRLWLLVRIADTFASVKTPSEAFNSLRNYLADLSPVFLSQSRPGTYALYYHEIKDVRGVVTNVIHQATAIELNAQYGFFPLLYFATGALYIGPGGAVTADGDDVTPTIAGAVLSTLTESSAGDTARDGLRRQKFDFEPYVYAFADAQSLLGVVQDVVVGTTPNAKTAIQEIDGLVAKRQELTEEWRNSLEQHLGIQLLDPKEHKTFNELWSLVRLYLLYTDTLLRDLSPGTPRLDWFLQTFAIQEPAAANLRQEADIWARGGVAKYVLIIAYHFLRGPDYVDRPAEALPPAQVIGRLHEKMAVAVALLDTQAGRQAAVAQMGLRQDLERYLAEHLYLSFAPANHLEADSYASYLSAKRKGHTGKVCSLCNRHSDYTQELRTGILDDFGRVFSNRVLPAGEAPQGNRLWCPICQLEFVLRKILGMGLPGSAHYKNTRRIYLYVLPTFSFTPEHVRLFEPLLRPFHRVTSLPVRDYGKDHGLPHRWLERRSFDPDWIEELQDILGREADKIAGWGGRSFVGERTSLGLVRGQPHYYLITWEKAARESESDDARVATNTEAWAKALFVSTVISGLTSCKVYVTERPYLPVADPAELKATITLDGPPPALRGVLGSRSDEVTLYGRERGRRSGLERVLDASAALWTVTADVHAARRNTKDKHISGRLETLNTSPLAGATFYKEYGRLNEGDSPYPALTQACEVLLELQADLHGGKLMDLVERIATKSLGIALPLHSSGRGKARRYELVFREGVSAMRKAQQLIPEMREAALGNKPPPPHAVAELKQLAAGTLLKGLERRQETKRGDIVIRAWGDALGRLVGEFMDILVDDLYLGRAGGSFARFLRLENTLADGVYYYTDRNLSRLWDDYKREREAHKTALANHKE